MAKQATGETLPLDIRVIARRGVLAQTGAVFSWRWNNGSNIAMKAEADAVTLIYNWKDEPVKQRVAVVWTPCNYGGRRAWWECPYCRRRVALLYSASKYFACRHCYELCYFSQQETPTDRKLRRAQRIRQRLGQEGGGHFAPIPAKPKGMHWETYERLYDECKEREAADMMQMMARASALLLKSGPLENLNWE